MKFTENSTSRIAAEAQSLLDEIASLPEMKLSAVSKKSAMAVFVDIVNGFIREGAMASARKAAQRLPPCGYPYRCLC